MYLIFWKWKVGSAVARLCERQGISYDIRDDSNTPTGYDAYEVIIPSPWVPESHPIYATGRVMCELDFAYQFLPNGFQIISITGTDGKSTTAWIMYNILEKEFSVKKSIYLSGNFDIPFSATVLDILIKWYEEGIIVVEVSSFMSFCIQKYTSDYSIFTNLKPDHLNWHKNLQGYVDAKMNLMSHTIFRSIINEQIIEFAQKNNLILRIPKNTRIFSNDDNSKDSTNGQNIIVNEGENSLLSETHFSGVHNAMNILSCMIVAQELWISSKHTENTLREITGLPHRLQVIDKKWGITIVEDSKSTSSQSLSAALSSFWVACNLLLIVGGSDKGDSFLSLAPIFAKRVKAMVAIWATKAQFVQIAEQENIPYLTTDKLVEGVNWLYSRRNDWDVLMLSPGCASFGLFENYLDRANQFREAIKKIPHV